MSLAFITPHTATPMPVAVAPTMMIVSRRPPQLRRFLAGAWYGWGMPNGCGTPNWPIEPGGGMLVGVALPRNSLGVGGPSFGALNGPSPIGVERGPPPGIGVERPGWGPDGNGGWYDMA